MITQLEILKYEVAASWWAWCITGHNLQRVVARYFAWKVKRKYIRYKRHVEYTKIASKGKGL